MLTSMEAARLLRRADRWRRDGTRSVFARLALGKLIQAGDRGDQAAVDAVWAMWRSVPDEVLWARLARWRRPAGDVGWDPGLRGVSLVALGEGSADAADFRTALLDAAVRTDHPIGEIARRRILAGDQDLVDAVCAAAMTRAELVPLCVEHGLAPADPADGAVFFLLTGQIEHYRAVDPDGSLLPLGYEAATADLRRRVRTAMVEAGDLDVARVLAGAGRRDRRHRPSTEEARYLATRLADRRAWAELWRLVRHLPLLDAVTAAQLFGDWRPTGAHDQTLFDRLTGTAPEPLAAAHRALTTFRTTRIEVAGLVHDGAFSPDRRRLAVLTTPGALTRSRQGVISVFDLPGGDLVERYELTAPAPLPRLQVDFLPLGDVLIAAELRMRPGTHDRYRALLWCSDGHMEERGSFPAVDALAPSPTGGGGFVVCTADDALEFRDGAGDLVSTVRLRDELGPTRRFPAVRAMATEPGSGRLAVAGDGLAIFDARDAAHVRLLAHEQPPGYPVLYGAAFIDHDHLVTTDIGRLRQWRLTGNRLEWHTAPVQPLRSGRPWRCPIVTPQRGEFAVIEGHGTVRYLDTGSLTDIDTPRELSGTRGLTLWGAPGGGPHALGGEGFVDVVSQVHSTAVTALAGRPLAELTLADLATVSEALRHLEPGSAAWPFLDLLRDCLDHRFASDVQLGTDTRAVGGAYDIAITGRDERDERPW